MHISQPHKSRIPLPNPTTLAPKQYLVVVMSTCNAQVLMQVKWHDRPQKRPKHVVPWIACHTLHQAR